MVLTSVVSNLVEGDDVAPGAEDRICAGGGADRIVDSRYNDRIAGGSGDDFLTNSVVTMSLGAGPATTPFVDVPLRSPSPEAQSSNSVPATTSTMLGPVTTT